ncbi:zinc finger protein-domain-containing protein [Penicillium verhagenii]|uniref:zinc finger protein-domain-containing protein n=1 Tax=Penicillium verhagenii TaxID=1562060 RepID=UPI002544E01F|nr:zinc finger protein-domain-containing protein [Penicillium verhagenii]KAJ5919135.1 zinc finger protein-domain-containing protein [Penicillium verhagenii]
MDCLSRSKQSSSFEDSPISFGSSFVADMDLTNQLSAVLDREHNDTVVQELNLLDATLPPDKILRKVLSPDSFTRTASSFACLQQGQQLPTSVVGYRTIGFGQCGLVFERPGRGYVPKVAKPSYEDGLWADFKAHYSINQAFLKYQTSDRVIECRVPKLFSYITKEHQGWWNESRPVFTTIHNSLSLPAPVLISQRILPLPKVAREALVAKYCPESSQALVKANPTNRDCLARVYLGRRRITTAPSANFTLRNFNLHLDQMVELGLPVQKMAGAIGEALAIVHWAAHVDGYDIEFVLGSEGYTTYTRDLSTVLNLSAEQVAALPPQTDIESMISGKLKHRITRLWMLDFNLCNMWDENAAFSSPGALISQLVISFFENDPYYPLPLMECDLDQELWAIFTAQYIQTAAQVLTGKDPRLAALPLKFIDDCIERERDNIKNGLGHGHRYLKQ